MANSDVELEIYKQNCEDFRFYGDMRFKQLTLWSVGMGFVLNVVYGKEAVALTAYQKGIWYEAAFFWTAVIWVMEVRSSVHGVRRTRSRGRMERDGDTDLSNKWTLLNATNAVALLYSASCFAWAVQLVEAWGACVRTVWVVAIVWTLLVVFTFREYWPLLKHAVRKWRL